MDKKVTCASCKKEIQYIDITPHAICSKCDQKEFKKAYKGDYEEAKRIVQAKFIKTY